MICRHANGISLNNVLEYVLDKPEDEGGVPLEFENRQQAYDFMIEAGADEDDLWYYLLQDEHGQVFDFLTGSANDFFAPRLVDESDLFGSEGSV